MKSGNMSKIREEASTLLKIRIEPNRWKQTMDRLDVQGAFTRKNERDFLIMLCEHVEKIEEALNVGTTSSQTNL